MPHFDLFIVCFAAPHPASHDSPPLKGSRLAYLSHSPKTVSYDEAQCILYVRDSLRRRTRSLNANFRDGS
jgi:hypothetical protein